MNYAIYKIVAKMVGSPVFREKPSLLRVQDTHYMPGVRRDTGAVAFRVYRVSARRKLISSHS
jgi:hypothetical protein